MQLWHLRSSDFYLHEFLLKVTAALNECLTEANGLASARQAENYWSQPASYSLSIYPRRITELFIRLKSKISNAPQDESRPEH